MLRIIDVNKLHTFLTRRWGINGRKQPRPTWLSEQLKTAAERKRDRRNRARLAVAYENPDQRFKNWQTPADLLQKTGYKIGGLVAARKGSGTISRIQYADKDEAGRPRVRLSTGRYILLSTLKKSYIQVPE